MEYLDITDKKTEGIIKICLENKTLIPVIGAGYTAGEKNKTGSVPNGDQFKEVMISTITSSSPALQTHVDQLHKRSFSQIAELYMNKDIVPRSRVKEDIEQNFLGVKLEERKKDFLKIEWPYIYTLNIDDAIEENSKYTKVLPYLKLSEKARSFRCIYKIHGDATHEILYDEKTSLIFSSSQYIRSLIKNESMLLFLKTDLIENNVLFIGCSLRDEIDLLYSIVGQDETPSNASRRIYVTTKKPDPIRELDLKTYNINTVILTPDYDTFYSKIIDIKDKSKEKEKDRLERFLFKGVNNLEAVKNINIDFILKSEYKFNEKPHYITVPNF
ncbi:MAG: SIR2 family protein, partial [Candidatus Electrothrix sp. AS4_5]|nr:SIR2 family protein [Candidatus Electrothrix gigas]